MKASRAPDLAPGRHGADVRRREGLASRRGSARRRVPSDGGGIGRRCHRAAVRPPGLHASRHAGALQDEVRRACRDGAVEEAGAQGGFRGEPGHDRRHRHLPRGLGLRPRARGRPGLRRRRRPDGDHHEGPRVRRGHRGRLHPGSSADPADSVSRSTAAACRRAPRSATTARWASTSP